MPIFLPLKLKFYIWCDVETYTNISPWRKITIDDVINFVTCPCKFDRPECNFSNVNKIWKMTTSVNFFDQEDLLVKFLCEYNL